MKLLIKWKGYKRPTWERMVNFARDSPHCLQRYWLKYEDKVAEVRSRVEQLMERSETGTRSSKSIDKTNSLHKYDNIKSDKVD